MYAYGVQRNFMSSGGNILLENHHELKRFRVILNKEEPSTDIKNITGIITFEGNNIKFTPQTLDPNLERVYTITDLTNAVIMPIRIRFRKKNVLLLQFRKKNVSVLVYIDPVDVEPDYLLNEILAYKEKLTKGSISGVVGSFFEYLGTESKKIVREVGAIIETSSKELSEALGQTTQFIREATQSANLLDDIEINLDQKGKTINLNATEIDEILKRSLASEKVEAMIAGLIAKGLTSAKDQKYQEAKDALKIAREAAKSEEMKEYQEIVDKNIKDIEEAESTETFNPHLNERAIKYANEARDIVAKWENSENQDNNEKA